jgi:hypothetical protein
MGATLRFNRDLRRNNLRRKYSFAVKLNILSLRSIDWFIFRLSSSTQRLNNALSRALHEMASQVSRNRHAWQASKTRLRPGFLSGPDAFALMIRGRTNETCKTTGGHPAVLNGLGGNDRVGLGATRARYQ